MAIGTIQVEITQSPKMRVLLLFAPILRIFWKPTEDWIDAFVKENVSVRPIFTPK